LLLKLEAAAKALQKKGGGYKILHTSTGGLELGVYVLPPGKPDDQGPHPNDEAYVLLEGEATLVVEGKRIRMKQGETAFVPAGARHHFEDYEQLKVLVIFQRWAGNRCCW
jgi:mannose-6-phosphate isomerase-like protein (cupin superfamily)